MNAVTAVRRMMRFGIRSLLVPALFLAAVLGLAGGHNDTATVSPGPSAIIAELNAHHELPKGTRLTLGDPDRPTVITYDEKGRLVMTPPRGQSFGSIMALGFVRLERIASDNGIDIARAGESPATATTSSAH
jgi:hypothetical protein